MLANSEVQVPTPRASGLEVAGSLKREVRLVGRREVRRTPKEPRHVLRKHIQHFPRSLAPRETLRICGEGRQIAIPSPRQLSPLHLLDLGRERRVLRPVPLKELRPLPTSLRSPSANSGREVLSDALRHEKLRVLGPPVRALAKPDLLFAQRLAVRGGSILPVRAVADVTV